MNELWLPAQPGQLWPAIKKPFATLLKSVRCKRVRLSLVAGSCTCLFKRKFGKVLQAGPLHTGNHNNNMAC